MEYDGIPYRVVSPTADIGEGTKIMPFVTIADGAKVGKNCYIGQGCVIGGGVNVGDGCVFGNNCSIGVLESLYENEPPPSDNVVHIGNNVTLLHNCFIEAGGTVVSDNVAVSQNCIIQRGVFIGVDCCLLPNCYIAFSSRLEGENRLGANTVVGKYTTLQHGVCGAFNCVFKNKTVYKKQSDEILVAGDFNSENTYSTIMAFSKKQFLAWRKQMRLFANGKKQEDK